MAWTAARRCRRAGAQRSRQGAPSGRAVRDGAPAACDLPAVAARSAYIRLQTHFAKGEFDAALRMAREAYEGYMAGGKTLDAVRTHVGRMSVLLELGLYQEALDAGQVVLDALDGEGEIVVSPTTEQCDMLTALVQQNRGRLLRVHGPLRGSTSRPTRVAEERYRALGETDRVGEILDNRGAILLYLGRGNEALAAHEAAAQRLRRGRAYALLRQSSLQHRGGEPAAGELPVQPHRVREGAPPVRRPRRAHGQEPAHRSTRPTLTWTSTCTPRRSRPTRNPAPCYAKPGWRTICARALWGMGVALAATSNLEEAERGARRSR